MLPSTQRLGNLDRIARLIRGSDIVGLQEVDAGSLRSGYINQTEYLAMQGHFPHWYDQTNRNFGHFGQHGLGLLSRLRPTEIREETPAGSHPGPRRAGGAVRPGTGRAGRHHPAPRARPARTAAATRIPERGDARVSSCRADGRFQLRLWQPRDELAAHTYARCVSRCTACTRSRARRPARNIDHILVSPTLQVENVSVVNHAISDHLPIMMDVVLPASVDLPGLTGDAPARRPYRFSFSLRVSNKITKWTGLTDLQD